MAISTQPNSLVQALDRANPNSVPSMLAAVKIGTRLRSLRTAKRASKVLVPAANPYVIATLYSITLPDDAKGAALSRVYVRAGTTTGSLVCDGDPDNYSSPSTGHCAISPSGDLTFAAADVPTSVDFEYAPQIGDVYEGTFNVLSNVATLPAAQGAAIILLEVEGLVGTVKGKFIIDKPGASEGTSAHACLNVAKTLVEFAAADAVTSARIKYLVASAVDVDAVLEATSNFI